MDLVTIDIVMIIMQTNKIYFDNTPKMPLNINILYVHYHKFNSVQRTLNNLNKQEDIQYH